MGKRTGPKTTEGAPLTELELTRVYGRAPAHRKDAALPRRPVCVSISADWACLLGQRVPLAQALALLGLLELLQRTFLDLADSLAGDIDL